MFTSKLIHIGSPISNDTVDILSNNMLPKELLSFLSKINGLRAFESALIVRSVSINSVITNIKKWNEFTTWKYLYNNKALENYLFFGEDVFGNQFGIYNNEIVFFNIETGDISFFANSFEKWAKEILNNYRLHTGYDFAHQYQVKFGMLPDNYRLCPKIPFILGGKYILENLICCPTMQSFIYLSSIAVQIQNVPDGTKIKIHCPCPETLSSE